MGESRTFIRVLIIAYSSFFLGIAFALTVLR